MLTTYCVQMASGGQAFSQGSTGRASHCFLSEADLEDSAPKGSAPSMASQRGWCSQRTQVDGGWALGWTCGQKLGPGSCLWLRLPHDLGHGSHEPLERKAVKEAVSLLRIVQKPQSLTYLILHAWRLLRALTHPVQCKPHSPAEVQPGSARRRICKDTTGSLWRVELKSKFYFATKTFWNPCLTFFIRCAYQELCEDYERVALTTQLGYPS